jgi:hypothetical protein
MEAKVATKLLLVWAFAGVQKKSPAVHNLGSGCKSRNCRVVQKGKLIESMSAHGMLIPFRVYDAV